MKATTLISGTDRLLGNAYLLLLITTMIWAGNAIAGKIAVGHISPMALTTFRWIGVIMLLAIFSRRAIRADWPVLRAKLPYLCLLGTVGFTAFNALFYTAAHYTTAINIGILQGSVPILVFIGAFAVYRTPITGIQALGAFITVLGVVLVAVSGDVTRLTSLAFNRGDVMMLIATLCYASYITALRHRPNVSQIAMFAAMAFGAMISSLPLLAIEVAYGHFQTPTATGWAVLLFVVLFPSFLSQLFFMRSVHIVGPGRAGIFVNLVPIFTAGLGVLVLGEGFHWFHAAALVLVLGGIWLAESRRKIG